VRSRWRDVWSLTQQTLLVCLADLLHFYIVMWIIAVLFFIQAGLTIRKWHYQDQAARLRQVRTKR